MSQNNNGKIIIYDKSKRTGYKNLPTTAIVAKKKKSAPQPPKDLFLIVKEYLDKIGDEGKYEKLKGNIIRINTGSLNADGEEILLYMTYGKDPHDKEISISLIDDNGISAILSSSDNIKVDLSILRRIAARVQKRFPQHITETLVINEDGLFVLGHLKDYVRMKWFITEILLGFFDHE